MPDYIDPVLGLIVSAILTTILIVLHVISYVKTKRRFAALSAEIKKKPSLKVFRNGSWSDITASETEKLMERDRSILFDQDEFGEDVVPEDAKKIPTTIKEV